MPLYEVLERENERSRGVYFYDKEDDIKRFICLLPDMKKLSYRDRSGSEAIEIRKKIREELREEVGELICDWWEECLKNQNRNT